MIKEEILINQLLKLSISEQTSFLHNSNEIVNKWNNHLNSIKTSSNILTSNLIQEFCTINSNQNYFDTLEFDKMIMWHKTFLDDQKQNLEDGHNFNIFQLFRREFDFRIQETMHSKLVKFLLDPHEMHGLGNLFLLEFLNILGIDSPEQGVWQITAEQGKIDILLQRNFPQSIIVIENKSNWACDQNNQLYRYWHKAIYLKTKEIDKKFYDTNTHNYQIVYLSPNSFKKCEEQSLTKPKDDLYNSYIGLPEKIPMDIVNISFENEIQKWLENCKNKTPKTNHRIREYISQYQMLCKSL